MQGWASSLTFDMLMNNASMSKLTPPTEAAAEDGLGSLLSLPAGSVRLPLTATLLYTSNAYSFSPPAGHRDRAGFLLFC